MSVPELMRDPLAAVAMARGKDFVAFEQCMGALEGLPPEARRRVIQAVRILLDLDKKDDL